MNKSTKRILLPLSFALLAFAVGTQYLSIALIGTTKGASDSASPVSHVKEIPKYLVFSDMPQLRAASTMLWDGKGSQLYTDPYVGPTLKAEFPDHPRFVCVMIPPFALPLLLPIHLIPIDWILPIWTALEVLAILAGIYVLKRTFDLSWYSFFWWVGMVALSGAAFEEVKLGQITAFVFLSFCCMLLALRKDRPAMAGFFGMLMLLKPQLTIPMMVFLVGARKFKPVIWFGVFALCLAAAAYLLVGQQGFIAYKTFSYEGLYNNKLTLSIELTTTLRGQLLRFFPQGLYVITNIATGIWMAFLLWLCVTARKYRDGNWLAIATIISMPLGLLLSPYIQYYDMIMLIPSLIALQASGAMKRLPQWVSLILLLPIILSLNVPYIFVHYLYLLHGGVINPFFWTYLVFAIFFMVVVLKKPKPDLVDPGARASRPLL